MKIAANPDQIPTKIREIWLDIAKGLGIFLVVLGHTIRGLQNEGIMDPRGMSHNVDSWIYSFHMPLFFLLSGYFIEKAVKKPLKIALTDRAKTLVWPYFVWASLQTLVQIATSHFVVMKYGWDTLIAVLWHGPMQFWFLYALFLTSLIWIGLRKLKVSPWVLLGLFWALHALQRGSSSWEMWDMVRIMGVWFAVGAILGTHTEQITRVRGWPLWFRMAMIIGGFAVTTYGAITTPDLLPRNEIGWALPGLIASLVLCVSVPNASPVARKIAWVGALSLEIFLVHTLASACVRILLKHAFKIDDAATHLILGVFAGIAAPLALVMIGRRYRIKHLFRFGTVA